MSDFTVSLTYFKEGLHRFHTSESATGVGEHYCVLLLKKKCKAFRASRGRCVTSEKYPQVMSLESDAK